MTNIPEENLLSFSLSLFAYCDITGKKIKFKEGRLIERNTEAGERERKKEKRGEKKKKKEEDGKCTHKKEGGKSLDTKGVAEQVRGRVKGEREARLWER